MRLRNLIALLLLLLCFALAAWLQPRHSALERNTGQPDTILATLLGESRRLLASQLYIKADAYYHMGYYPSIFDSPKDTEEAHEEHGAMLAKAGLQKDHQCADHLGDSKDWLDRFGRNFYPAKHLHADQAGHQAEQEVVPWLRISAELDPQNISTYTLAAFWLRTQLKRPDAAEAFLREGLRANPGSAEILLELGRIYLDHHKQPERARNVLELAFRRWEEQESRKSEPDIFVRQQILGQLVVAERQLNHPQRVIELLRLLKPYSPTPAIIQQQIDELEKPPPAPR
jgi:tetratricopeptide (TPR) repeat protein